MRFARLTFALGVFLSTLPFPRANAQNPAEPGRFDYYLLNLSWSPEFCKTVAPSPQCKAHAGFVLHGLWPQNNNGTWPANCATHAAGPTNPAAWLDMTPDLSLIAHEWSKHGACTTLDGDTYFTVTKQAFRSIVTPQRLLEIDREVTMAPGAIIGLFVRANPALGAANFNVSCEDDRLTAIEVCLGKDLRPVECVALHPCAESMVKITSPGQLPH